MGRVSWSRLLGLACRWEEKRKGFWTCEWYVEYAPSSFLWVGPPFTGPRSLPIPWQREAALLKTTLNRGLV